MTGHLSELDYDRLVLGDEAERPRIEAHLAACAECRAGVEQLRALDARVALKPRRVSRPKPELIVGAVAGLLALAATLFFVTRPAPEEVLVLRGGALDLEVRVSDGHKTRVVDEGATVHPGERAGFALRVAEAGHVLVFGWDETQAIYVALPESTRPAEARAVAFEATKDVVALPVAVKFDARLGSETLAAVYCKAPFALTELVPALRVPDRQALAQAIDAKGCALRTIALDKRAP